mmetsp:Transcript_3766/g.8298  ORF Transcript_3766/g.8298 Transcript_3766/m.8298 type:complete len:266 (-) Transcript_3766:2617-3414(-)
MAGTSALIAVAVALATLAAAQTCPCSFAPVTTAPQIVLVSSSPDTCATETRTTGGCFCVSGTGDAGTCDIDTSAVTYEFTGVGSLCTEVSSPAAICPGTQASVTCSIDQAVAWVLDCTIPQGSIPAGATITSVSAAITQSDFVTLNGDGTPGDDYTISYQTLNAITPVGSFPTWPATPEKTEGPLPMPGSGSVTWTDSSSIPQVVLSATAAGVAEANSQLNDGSNDGVTFTFLTAQSASTSGFNSFTFFPVTSAATVILTATYST